MNDYKGFTHFLTDIIDSDLAEGRVSKVATRFPPEPNGCLHIGSAKAIFINYGAAKRYGGSFNLRFDDTNPVKEETEFVQSILEDVEWLIGGRPDNVFYGSDYFEQTYQYALKLIHDGKAFVCDLSADEIREYRGTLTSPGRNSPWRDRSVEENLDLFERMKNGEFANGEKTLRAKIDMASPNITLRDPVIYRIVHAEHHRQGNKWCIYPMYDFAHPIQDATEGITHSMCSFEFDNNRPLYDWVLDSLGISPRPHQYEFARINVTNTVMSKRYLKKLVDSGFVDGWDDPRMPTLSGLRRKGCTPEAIFDFIRRAGVAKNTNLVDIRLLDHCVREELNLTSERRIAVLEPVRLTVTNYPEGKTEYFELPNTPQKEESTTRSLPFSRELYIEKADFSADPPPKYQRLAPGREVRLMGGYIVKCTGFDTDAAGNVTEIFCEADLETGNGMPADGRKIKGTIHWLSAAEAVKAHFRIYGSLFTIEDTADIPEGKGYDDYLNPDSLIETEGYTEPSLAGEDTCGVRYQFVRNGYFTKDTRTGSFLRTVTLKDSFSKTLQNK